MRIPHDDALLRDMIADERAYSEKVIKCSARGIMRMEPPDVLAFYGQQIMETDRRIRILTAARKIKNR